MDTLISMFLPLFLNCGQTGACIQRNDIDIAVLRQEGLKDVLGIILNTNCNIINTKIVLICFEKFQLPRLSTPFFLA